MSRIQRSAGVDERGGFLRGGGIRLGKHMCVLGCEEGGGGVKVCVKAEIPYVAQRGCLLHHTALLLKSYMLGRFKSVNETSSSVTNYQLLL